MFRRAHLKSKEADQVLILEPVNRREGRLKMLSNIPPSVRAIPSLPVQDASVTWRPPTPEELRDGVTDVVEVSTSASARKGGRRVLLRQVFRAEVDDSREVALLKTGVEFLQQVGALSESGASKLMDELRVMPDSLKRRQAVMQELQIFTESRRPLRRHDHSIQSAYLNFVLPIAHSVGDALKNLFQRKGEI